MITSHELNVQPSWRFILSHPAHFLSFGFGAGLFPRSPGTAGTLVAFPIYWLIAPHLSIAQYLIMLLWAYAFGILACEKTGRTLGDADYGGIVWDEIVAFLLVLFFTPPGVFWWLLASRRSSLYPPLPGELAVRTVERVFSPGRSAGGTFAPL